jgi:phosphoglucan,water dikinase
VQPYLGVNYEAVDYSRQALSLDGSAREDLGRRLAFVGAALEAEYGAPQTVEVGLYKLNPVNPYVA